MSEIPRYKLSERPHGVKVWMNGPVEYVLASDHDRVVAEFQAELREAELEIERLQRVLCWPEKP